MSATTGNSCITIGIAGGTGSGKVCCIQEQNGVSHSRSYEISFSDFDLTTRALCESQSAAMNKSKLTC